MRNKCQSFFTVSFDLSNFHILSTACVCVCVCVCSAQFLKQKTNILVVKMFHISNKGQVTKIIKIVTFQAFLLPWYCRNHLTYINRVWLKNQLENIPSNNTVHIWPFYLRYQQQPWLNFKYSKSTKLILSIKLEL